MVDGGAFAAVDLTVDPSFDEGRAQAEDRVGQPAVAQVGESFEAGVIGTEPGRCAEVDGQSDGSEREADQRRRLIRTAVARMSASGNMFSRSG